MRREKVPEKQRCIIFFSLKVFNDACHSRDLKVESFSPRDQERCLLFKIPLGGSRDREVLSWEEAGLVNR